MPVHTNSIAVLASNGSAASTQLFQDIRGTPKLASQQVEVLRRRGVDGVGLRNLGEQGEPFPLLCYQFLANYATAKTAVVNAQALQGDGAEYGIRLTKDSVDWGVFGVIRVDEVLIRAVGAVAGSLVANPGVLLITRWMLVNQEIPTS